jgi:hypothetical protein
LDRIIKILIIDKSVKVTSILLVLENSVFVGTHSRASLRTIQQIR